MKEVYKGIFVREKVVFEGEVLEYQIYRKRGDQTPAVSGSLERREPPVKQEGTRFALLNQMGLSFDMKNENTLRSQMEEYLTADAVSQALFGLLYQRRRKQTGKGRQGKWTGSSNRRKGLAERWTDLYWESTCAIPIRP